MEPDKYIKRMGSTYLSGEKIKKDELGFGKASIA